MVDAEPLLCNNEIYCSQVRGNVCNSVAAAEGCKYVGEVGCVVDVESCHYPVVLLNVECDSLTVLTNVNNLDINNISASGWPLPAGYACVSVTLSESRGPRSIKGS